MSAEGLSFRHLCVGHKHLDASLAWFVRASLSARYAEISTVYSHRFPADDFVRDLKLTVKGELTDQATSPWKLMPVGALSVFLGKASLGERRKSSKIPSRRMNE